MQSFILTSTLYPMLQQETMAVGFSAPSSRIGIAATEEDESLAVNFLPVNAVINDALIIVNYSLNENLAIGFSPTSVSIQDIIIMTSEAESLAVNFAAPSATITTIVINYSNAESMTVGFAAIGATIA